MFKWAASVSTKFASTLSETFAPLFRSPLEQLIDAWRKIERDCQAIMQLDQAQGNGGGSAAAIGAASRLDDPQVLLDSPIVAHLNQLVEALVKEEEDQAVAMQLAQTRAEQAEEKNIAKGIEKGSAPFDATAGRDNSAGKSSTGPCFEYFLNEKILDRLCALGLPDVRQHNTQHNTHRISSSS